MSAAGDPTPHTGPAVPPGDVGEVDAVLGVLVRHARALADLGAVRVAAGTVSVEIGEPAAGPPAGTVREVAPTPLAVVPEPAPTAAPSAPEPTAPASGTVEVTSATVGVFYRAPEPGASPFVVEGDVVGAGQQVAIVEAMKLMIPLESDRAGRVVEFLVGDGDSVEHGQPVLRLDPS